MWTRLYTDIVTKCKSLRNAELTFGRDRLVIIATAEQPGAVEDLVQDDGEAVDVSFLSSRRHSDDRQTLRFQQLRRRPQQRYKPLRVNACNG